MFCFGAVLYFGMADRHNLPMPAFWSDIEDARSDFIEDTTGNVSVDSPDIERRTMAEVIDGGQEFAIDTATDFAADEASRRMWSDLQRDAGERGVSRHKEAETTADAGDNIMQDAFENRLHDVQVEGEGHVIRILSDDNEGSRHQRFIVELNNGLTVIIAHNIDLAPRVQNLQIGDLVSFYGEYEWNNQGGVMHWTHDDPDGYHIGGWIEHHGRIYR